MVYVPPRICPGGLDAQNSLGIWDTNGSPNLGQMTRPSDSQQKKREPAEFSGLNPPGRPMSKIKRKLKER